MTNGSGGGYRGRMGNEWWTDGRIEGKMEGRGRGGGGGICKGKYREDVGEDIKRGREGTERRVGRNG